MALRELALRKLATTVEEDLEDYMRQHQIDSTWAADEQVMVCIDEHPGAQHLIRRAWRMADARQSPLLAVFVETPRWAHAHPENRRQLEENLRLAEDLGAQIVRLQADNVASALARAAHDYNVDSIVIGHSRHGRLHEILRGSIVGKLLKQARVFDVHLVAEREQA
jgi:two-component system sensor histidine kinase KdpD